MENRDIVSKEYKTPVYIRRNNEKYRKQNADKLKQIQKAKIAELKESGEYDAFKAERATYMKEYRKKKKLKEQQLAPGS